MKDQNKTKNQFIDELAKLRQRIAELEKSEAELKRAKEILKESEGKLKTRMENVNDIIFHLSPLGIIKYVSPNVRHIYGWNPEEIIGKHLKKTIPMSEVPKALKALKSVFSGKVRTVF